MKRTAYKISKIQKRKPAIPEPRFLEAQVITARQAGDELFESINIPQSAPQILAQVKAELSGRNVVAEIWGR